MKTVLKNSDKVPFKTQAAALYRHIKLKATAKSSRADKARTASVLDDFKNGQSHKLKEILNINEKSTLRKCQLKFKEFSITL